MLSNEDIEKAIVEELGRQQRMGAEGWKANQIIFISKFYECH